MKKLLALTLSSVMALSMLAGCGIEKEQTNSGTDNSLQYVVDKGELILGLDDTFPPMGFRDADNEIVGFDIDLAEAVCEKLGVTLVKQPIDWYSKEMELDTMNIDCIWNGMSINPEREAAMNMSDPYLEDAQVFIVRGNSGIETFDDLAGKTVAVQTGSTGESSIEAATEIYDSLGEVIGYASTLTALLDLEVGGVDAVLMDSIVGRYQIAQSGKDLVVLDEALVVEYYGIGFRKADTALGNAVADALIELKNEGVVTEIAEKWFGEDVTLIG